MRIINTLALLALLLAPLATRAADLTIQINGFVEYDDNAFRQNGEEDDDLLFRFRPQVKLHEDRGQDLRYSLSYAVPFEFAVDHGDELDDVDHEARGNASYYVSDRLELFGSDHFRYLRSALREVRIEDTVAGEGAFLINQERERTTLNDAEVGARYKFTPRLTGSARISHQFFDTDREDRAENWLLTGTADMSYVLTPKHTLGFGVRILRQQFEDRRNIPGSDVNSYNGFAQWTYRHDETLSLSLAAGPTLIDSSQDATAASARSPAIPFLTVPVGFNLTGAGLVDKNGNPVSGLVTNSGDRIISQFGSCPEIESTGDRVFTEFLCPFTVSAPGVLLDEFVDASEIMAAETVITITDPFADGEDETSVDVFAEASIAKHWTENLHTALRYRRTQGGASGLGGAVINNTVNLSNTWDLAERWQLALRGDWSLRQSVVDSGVAQFVRADPVAGFPGVTPAGALDLVTVKGGGTSDIDTMRYGAAGRLTHRFSRNTSAWVQLTYNEQKSDSDTLGNSSDFENFLAVVGVRHVFDPIKLW